MRKREREKGCLQHIVTRMSSSSFPFFDCHHGRKRQIVRPSDREREEEEEKEAKEEKLNRDK